MLQTMRHLAQSWVFKGLMMILVVSFGIWGIGDIFKGNPLQRTVATVDGEPITVDALNKDFGKNLIKMRQSIGPDVTEQQAKNFGLLDQSLQSLIKRKQVALDIKRLGIDVTDKMTLDWIAAFPELRNKDGSFNRELFRQTVERENFDENSFIAEQKATIARREVLYPLANLGPAPDTIVDALARARGQKRIFDVIKLADDSVHDVPAPDDQALQEFYTKNPKLFTAAETRSVTIARLETDALAKDISVSDDQVKADYDEHIAKYSYPERRDILQVVLQDEGKAKMVAYAAKASGNLEAAGHDAGVKAVALNQTEQTSLLPELSKPVFELKDGQISDPIKSPLGWHVLQLKKITPARVAPLEEVKNPLRAALLKDAAVDASSKAANELDDELAAGHALEDIADGLKMRLIKIPALGANGKLPDGKDPQELPERDFVLKSAFTQNAGDVSPVMDDKAGNYTVVRTDQVTPSMVKPFDAVKTEVVAAWKAKQQETAAGVEAEKIAKQLGEGKSASSFAAHAGVDVRVSKPISLLGDNDPSLPTAILPQLLKLKKGQTMTSPVGNAQLIFRLAEVVDMEPTAIKEAHGKISGDLDTQNGTELTQEYVAHLQVLYPPKINHEVLDGMRQQGS